MNRFTLSIIAAAIALPALAQQAVPAAPAASQPKIVASINGENITQEQLDLLYDRLGTKVRDEYEKNGGKAAFLEAYLRKRLVVQEALKSGFDKRPDVRADMEASKESTLFDRYVRDVVSAPIVTPEEIRKYYNDNPEQFQTQELVHARHILIMPGNGPGAKTDAQAKEMIEKVAAELRQQNVFPAGTAPDVANRLVLAHFADAAKKYSEDPGSAELGGDLGWAERGKFDPTFDEAAWSLRKGTVSGIIKSSFGYHLIAVEDKKPAGAEPFAEAQSKIREYLMTQHAADVVNAVGKLVTELRQHSSVNVYKENIK
ncbi:MAG: PpiC-type peptidyl-prolyl cis-trans isomerase [Acidobacteria bacterium]|nr:PpiC-type peptidyl-prolyl cis-trans isomerase [Acidobacteriota bacterium]